MTLVQSPRCECRIEEGLCPEEAEVSCCVCKELLCKKHASWRGDFFICKPTPDDRACGTALELRHDYIFKPEAVR